MKIFVTMTKQELSDDISWIGQGLLKDGFIHACTIELAHRIIDKFDKADLYQVWIDTNLLTSKLLFEDKHDNHYYYPHIYGLINISSIIDILPMDRCEVIDKKHYFKDATYF